VPPIAGIPASIETLWKQPVSWFGGLKFLVRMLWHSFRLEPTYSSEKFQSPGLSNPAIGEHTRIYPIRLPAETLKAIQTSCKAQNVSVHSALSAAAFIGYHKYYQSNSSFLLLGEIAKIFINCFLSSL
jgi:hypothetical protein